MLYKSLLDIAKDLKSLSFFIEKSKKGDDSLVLKIADLESKTSDLLNLVHDNEDKFSILESYFLNSKDFSETEYLAGSRLSAVSKGKEVLRKLDELEYDISNYAFVSLGGGDGTELYTEIENSSANYGLLLEYDFNSVHNFVKNYLPFQLKNFKRIDDIDVEVIECDLFDETKLQVAKNIISDWNVDGIIISIHAVLHELSTRSKLKSKFTDNDGNIDLEMFFNYIYEWHKNIILIIREPGIAENWKNEKGVYLTVNDESKEKFLNILDDIDRSHFNGNKESNYTYFEEQNKFYCQSELAIESLTKLFYNLDYEYEKREKVTSVSRENIITALTSGQLFEILESEPFYTDSVLKNMKKFGVKITKNNGSHPLSTPQCFTYTIASKGKHEKINK